MVLEGWIMWNFPKEYQCAGDGNSTLVFTCLDSWKFCLSSSHWCCHELIQHVKEDFLFGCSLITWNTKWRFPYPLNFHGWCSFVCFATQKNSCILILCPLSCLGKYRCKCFQTKEIPFSFESSLIANSLFLRTLYNNQSRFRGQHTWFWIFRLCCFLCPWNSYFTSLRIAAPQPGEFCAWLELAPGSGGWTAPACGLMPRLPKTLAKT